MRNKGTTTNNLYLWVENLFNRVDRERLLRQGTDRYAPHHRKTQAQSERSC